MFQHRGIIALIAAMMILPQMGRSQGSRQVLGTIHLQEEDYSLVEDVEEDRQAAEVRVRIINPSIVSLLSETEYPVSLVFRKGMKSYLVLGFNVISSFFPPTENWYFLMNPNGRPFMDSDGCISLSAPAGRGDISVSDLSEPDVLTLDPSDDDSNGNSTVITMNDEDVRLISREDYVSGGGLLFQIHNQDIIALLRDTPRPVISLDLESIRVKAHYRETLAPPSGAFFTVDPSGKAIISPDGLMEITLIGTQNHQ